MADTEKPKETKADRYLRQIEQIETLRQQAVEELLEKRREIDDQLGALGHQPKTAGKPSRRRAASTKGKFCEICNIAGHDKRNHRNQDPVKKFTVEELSEKGLSQK